MRASCRHDREEWRGVQCSKSYLRLQIQTLTSKALCGESRISEDPAEGDFNQTRDFPPIQPGTTIELKDRKQKTKILKARAN